MAGPGDRAQFVAGRLQPEGETVLTVTPEDIARLIRSDELSFDDIKKLIRGVRYLEGHDAKFEYANTLLAEASDFLAPHTLRALVRADISDNEARILLERNKAFFRRLAPLLPSILRFFNEENLSGIVDAIDRCHNDFQYAGNAPRIDRQIREAKEQLTRASKLALEAAAAIKQVEGHFSHEYSRYRDIYYLPAPGPTRFVGDLVEELRLCARVMEIAHATAGINPKRLMIFGNDQRTSVVQDVYHMCCMWSGPKLVTTPGSDFAALCSLMFEAVSGASDEGLAGAINRYARSPERKQWDKEGEEDDPDDNFQSQKNQMYASSQAIDLCKQILQGPDLSNAAIGLLSLRIKREQEKHEQARTKYGPSQVYIDQMNSEQWDNMLFEAFVRLKPEQQLDLEEAITKGKTADIRDIEHGQRIRADRQKILDTKSNDSSN